MALGAAIVLLVLPLFPDELDEWVEASQDGMRELVGKTVEFSGEYFDSVTETSGDLNWREAVQLTEVAVQGDINKSRKDIGLAPLQYVSAIADIARDHSERMHSAGALFHSGQLGVDPFEGTGFLCGENILTSDRRTAIMVNTSIATDLEGKSVDSMAGFIWLQWSTSPPHKQNMLSPQYTVGGVGIYYDEETELMYATHNLCYAK